MNLSREQEQAFMKQYIDIFELQEQQMRQQEDLLNAQMLQTRSIKVLLLSIFIHSYQKTNSIVRMFYI